MAQAAQLLRFVGSSERTTSADRTPVSSVAARLERIATGDNSAREWLYDRYAGALYRRLRGRYGSRYDFDAEELLQDAFVWFFQRNAKILIRFLDARSPHEQTEAALEGYLWGLACGVASNHRRSLARSPFVPQAALTKESYTASPERQFQSRDILFRLAQCLKKNGSRVYLYYTLRYVDGLTPEEIATATGWSRKSTYKLKTALNDAVKRCVEFLRL